MSGAGRCRRAGRALQRVGVLACAALSACGARNFDNENDRLRRLTLEQEGRIRALEAERDELRSKLAGALDARAAALSPEALDALPRCAGISLERISGLQFPREGETRPARVVAYLDPADGRQRFVQIVGSLTVDAVIAGPEGSAQPVAVSTTLSPAQIRDAYRTSITGPYYLVEIPVESGPIPDEGTVTIRARFVDALSGLAHEAEATSRIRR